MRIKQKPEDFSVKESYRFDEVASGRYRVYLMDKQKLSTFEAVDRLRTAFGLKPGSISFCGLKDKQGRTEQLIAVEGADVDLVDDRVLVPERIVPVGGDGPVGHRHRRGRGDVLGGRRAAHVVCAPG